MKGSVAVLGRLAGREAAALVVDGQLEDLLVAAGSAAPETIWRGKLGRPIKGLGGVFVDLPGGTTGFLRQARGLRPGQPLLVQAAGVAEPGKAVPLTDRLLLKGRLAILTPGAPGLNLSRSLTDAAERERLSAAAAAAMAGAPEGLGLILRSAAEGADTEALTEEIAALRRVAEAILADTAGPPELLLDAPGPHDLARRDWPTPDSLAEGGDALAAHGVEEMVEALLRTDMPLGGGASMAIEPTRALVAVDVNTGPDTSPAAALKANLAALRALPRALRLRGLGGQVTLDLAPSPKRDRGMLEQALRAAFRRDGAETVLAGWTPLGHYELQRRRDRPPLAELLR